MFKFRLPTENIKFDAPEAMKPILFQHLCVYKWAIDYIKGKSVIDIACKPDTIKDVIKDLLTDTPKYANEMSLAPIRIYG